MTTNTEDDSESTMAQANLAASLAAAGHQVSARAQACVANDIHGH